MDVICRLCLTVPVEMACKLDEEFKILHKLSYLSIQIHLNDALPRYVCCTCFKTIVDIQNFRENVIQNENKLVQLLNNTENLDTFYQDLKIKNISLNNVKTEENADEDNYTDETIYYEYEDQANKTDRNMKNNHEVQITVKTENVTDIVTDTDIANMLNKKAKRTVKSKTNRITKPTIVTSKENIETNICNNSDLNPLNLIPTNDTKTELDKEGCIDTKNHVDETKTTDHKCLSCFKYLNSHTELIEHYKTKLTQDASEHKDGQHPNSERPYNCKICGRTFTSVYAIVRHGRAHSGRNLYCSHGCGYCTVYRGALRDHEKRHEKDFRYKCATCGAGFQVKTWHDQHQNVHNNVKPFVCDVCGMTFHMHRYLYSHHTTVHPEKMKGAKKYVCPHCDNTFCNIHSFRAHLEEHQGKRSFLCDLCGKVCASREQLKHHNNSHLGLKPFACSTCNKKFAKKFNLTVHQRAHAGEKHLCQVCGKHFAQRSTLLRHHRKRHPDHTEDNNSTKNKTVTNFSSY